MEKKKKSKASEEGDTDSISLPKENEPNTDTIYTEEPLPVESPTKQSVSGKNILSNTSQATPEQQKEVIKKQAGRITQMEQELKGFKSNVDGRFKDINTNITKMMFIVVVISIALVGFKGAALAYQGVNTGRVIELILTVILGFFGVKSTYFYTKEHPEKEVAEHFIDIGKEILDGVTSFKLTPKKKK